MCASIGLMAMWNVTRSCWDVVLLAEMWFSEVELERRSFNIEAQDRRVALSRNRYVYPLLPITITLPYLFNTVIFGGENGSRILPLTKCSYRYCL